MDSSNNFSFRDEAMHKKIAQQEFERKKKSETLEIKAGKHHSITHVLPNFSYLNGIRDKRSI